MLWTLYPSRCRKWSTDHNQRKRVKKKKIVQPIFLPLRHSNGHFGKIGPDECPTVIIHSYSLGEEGSLEREV